MAEKHTISCDLCGTTTERTARAGSLAGWLRRDVLDSVSKPMAEGMRDFSARVTFHVCPACLPCGSELPSPPSHPEVVEFADQEQDNVPPVAPTEPPAAAVETEGEEETQADADFVG